MVQGGRIVTQMEDKDLHIDDVVLVHFLISQEPHVTLKLRQVMRLYKFDDPILKKLPNEPDIL